MSRTPDQAIEEQLLSAVRELEPLIRQYAPEAERERRLSDPVSEATREAGLYRLWRPQTLGGFELDPMAGHRIIEEVSRIDSAAGWNLQLSNAVDTFGCWFGADAAREIFGSPDTILGGAFNPPRQAVPVDGGYRLSGRTPFCSGAHQCTWLVGLAVVMDGDTPRTGPGGAPDVRFTAFPAAEARIVENWNTMGMRGTGSHDVVLEDVFVPSARAVPFAPLETPGPDYGGPLYSMTIWPAVAALAPPALGIARAALDEFVEMAGKKTPAYTGTSLRERPVVQAQVAQAEAELGAGRAYLYETFAAAWDDVTHQRPITMGRKADMQRASTHAVLAAARAVDLLHAALGATGIRQEYTFERHFRDVHVITQHAFISASRYESVGQIMLGLDPDWSFFAF